MFELSGCRGSRFFVPQSIRAEIKDHRMESTVKPAAKRMQVTLLRPSGGDAIPTIELFLEDFADATPQDLESLVFALPGARLALPSYFSAISLRCHLNKVSGVTIVPISLKTRRFSALARTARRRRWSSSNRSRRSPICARRTRFSSRR